MTLVRSGGKLKGGWGRDVFVFFTLFLPIRSGFRLEQEGVQPGGGEWSPTTDVFIPVRPHSAPPLPLGPQVMIGTLPFLAGVGAILSKVSETQAIGCNVARDLGSLKGG